MQRKNLVHLWLVIASLLLGSQLTLCQPASEKSLGPFEGHADVGSVLPPGSATYDSAQKTFTVV